MIAKNITTGASFEVTNNGKNSIYFSGKCLYDPEGYWKFGELCTSLEKKNFDLTLTWKELNKIQNFINNISLILWP